MVIVPPLKFTTPVGRNWPRKLCVPPMKLIVPAPLIVLPAACVKVPPRLSVVPAGAWIVVPLLPPELMLKVPDVKFTVPVLLKATLLKSVSVPAPDLLKVPELLKAWAAIWLWLKSPSPVTLNTPPGRLLMMPAAVTGKPKVSPVPL